MQWRTPPADTEECVVTLRVVPFVLVLSVLWPQSAAAQLYSWRDAHGTLVVSNRPRADKGDMTTYAVAGSRSVRASQPALAKNRFNDTIEDQASRHGVSADLVRAVIQAESAFNPSAVSVKGAMGLMQLMPATAREFGVSNPFEPEQNITGGVRYLRTLLDRYDNDVELALAAYNAGPGNVEKYGDVPPFKETQAYVKKIAKATSEAAPPPPKNVIYTWIDIVNGQPVPRYSDKPPVSGAYSIVGRN
jgi:soluble lytic murein transglycosylase-like protein